MIRSLFRATSFVADREMVGGSATLQAQAAASEASRAPKHISGGRSAFGACEQLGRHGLGVVAKASRALPGQLATIEAQRRLAPHLHSAIRGAIPRAVLRRVRAATYHQVWWPAHDRPVYTDRLPIWTDRGYADPDTGELLPTWDEALDALDADPPAEPAHVVRFGEQDDIQGLTAGTPGAERAIGYLCKYVNKAIASTYDDGADASAGRVAHIDRLAEEVRWLPCAPTCANWLRFGIQPDAAQAGMVPGHCKHKAHDRDHLGLGGRRVLVSRKWSGKTLAAHKADRVAIVRQALEAAGIDPDDHDEMSVIGTEGRWSWELLGRNRVDAVTYAAAISQSIHTRQRWLRDYEEAKTVAAARAGPSAAAAARSGNWARARLRPAPQLQAVVDSPTNSGEMLLRRP